MLLLLMYLVIRMLLRLLVPDGQGEAAKDLEIVVLEEALLPGSIDFGDVFIDVRGRRFSGRRR